MLYQQDFDDYAARVEIEELYRKTLSRLAHLSTKEAEATLESAERHFRDVLDGEVLEVWLMFLRLIKRDLTRRNAVG